MQSDKPDRRSEVFQPPDYHIGNIPIYGRLVLAPMDGYSDQPFRSICRKMGAAFSVTSIINALDVHQSTSPIYDQVTFSESERPIGFQLYGSDPKLIVSCAEKLSQFEPDFFDINLGCSVRRIAGRGSGSGLLRQPELIQAVVSSLVKTINIPITAKIRLGWDQESMNYIEISRLLEENGISMIAVHGRTKSNSWKDPAVWNPIAEIKQAVSVPVIGNGDVINLEDIDLILQQTGCDGVMIGRAAIGNPWIFSSTSKNNLTKKEILDVVFDHWRAMTLHYGEEKAGILFRKHLKAYLKHEVFDQEIVRTIISNQNPMDMVNNLV